ncbi:MAG: chromosomal replication initiator protein DnaA [Dehalococcoidia bacterium]|jgi:chromosomal replication initiator protein|nr:MAG: chromosomal replication initiator protein DnaA [Dehalococcoidia bacterium]
MTDRTAREIWETALGEIQVQVNKSNYRTFFEKTVGLSCETGRFLIGTPSVFVAEYLDRSQRSLIEKTLIALTAPGTSVVFQVTGANAPGRSETRVPQREAVFFNPRYTFDSFITGAANRMAFAAAQSVAENPGHGYNPLFIYAGVGLGKTHLLHAIGSSAQAQGRKVLYISAERFTNEFVNAIRLRQTEDFHRRYRSVDILLVDDIQFISGKEQTEESFFHTFNELHNANRQIVVTSDTPPGALPLVQDRLRSRFGWGLTVDIQPPDLETRMAILRDKSVTHGVVLSSEVVELIARTAQGNIRELEGALNRVTAYAQLVGAAPTLELVKKALASVSGRSGGGHDGLPPVPHNRIISLVAENFQVTREDITGRRRDKKTVLARQVAMYLIKQQNGCSLAQIGEEFDRDHSTVIYACEKIAGELAHNAYLDRLIHTIRESLAG